MADIQTTSGMQAETPEDFGEDKKAVVARWMTEVKSYEKTFDRWIKRVPKIVARYRAEGTTGDRFSLGSDGADDRVFNILWSNIQTLQPAVYSKTPKPEVARRYADKDPVGRLASEVLERAAAVSIETCGFDDAMRLARDDNLLGARGQVWLRYVPTYGEETRDKVYLTAARSGSTAFDESGMALPPPPPRYFTPEDAPVDPTEVLFDDEQAPYMESGDPYRPVVYEDVYVEHVQWDAFGHVPAPEWRRVPAVWKSELMTREQLVERFGDVGKDVPLTHKVGGISDEAVASYGDVFKRANVYEIWDRNTRRVYWICEDYKDGPLDEQDDPLGLADFFPCPKPLYGTMTPESLVPVPDYAEYQSQAQELDELTERISLLTESIRVAGLYDGSHPEIEGLLNSDARNTLIPVNEWAAFAEKGGMDGAISWLPLETIVQALGVLTAQRQQIKADLYELTGLSDIVRGQGQASETATAQRIKGNFATMRLQDRQAEMARFARDCIALVSEIIAEHFSDSTIAMMAGVEFMGEEDAALFPQAVALLRDDKLRTFRVDIETESTVQADRLEEQNSRTEFLSTVTPFLREALAASQQYPALGPVLGEMLLFGVRGFRAGRRLETVFEQAIESMAKQPPQAPANENGADPAEAEAKMAEMQLRAAETQQKGQIDQARLQLDAEKLSIERQKAENAAANDQAKLGIEAAKLTNEQSAMLSGLMQAVMGADPAVVASVMAAISGQPQPAVTVAAE